MEKISRLRNELRNEMKSFLKDIVNDKVRAELDSMSTDDLYNICVSFKDVKKDTPDLSSARPIFIAYTDGGYSMQNKVGAGAYVLLSNGHEIKRGGLKVENATNNIAEIVAIECALKEIPQRAEVTIRSDSQYAIGVLSGSWSAQKNTELINEVKALIKKNKLLVNFEWVKGHAGNKYNEICDNLCDELASCDLNAEYARFKKKK